MKRLFCFTIAILGAFFTNLSVDKYFVNMLNQVQSITIINNDIEKDYTKDSKEFKAIIKLWDDALDKYRELPAFNIEKTDDIIKEMKTGLWLKLNFAEQLIHNQMVYKSIVIKLDDQNDRVKLIRGQNNTYDGRGYVLDLQGNTLDEIVNYLHSLYL